METIQYNPEQEDTPEFETDESGPSIRLEFFRHDEKDSSTGIENNYETRITKEWQAHAMDAGRQKNPDPDVAMVYGSPRERSVETAYAQMLSNQDIGGLSLEEVREKVSDNLKVGKKEKITENLNFNWQKGTPFGDEVYDHYENQKDALRFMFEKSDVWAKMFKDKESTSYSRAAANVASLVYKYADGFERWNEIVEKNPEKYDEHRQLQRFLGSHGGVTECFLMKVIEKVEGREAVVSFLSSRENQNEFDFSEGFSVVIRADDSGEKQIEVTFEDKSWTITNDQLEEIIDDGVLMAGEKRQPTREYSEKVRSVYDIYVQKKRPIEILAGKQFDFNDPREAREAVMCIGEVLDMASKNRDELWKITRDATRLTHSEMAGEQGLLFLEKSAEESATLINEYAREYKRLSDAHNPENELDAKSIRMYFVEIEKLEQKIFALVRGLDALRESDYWSQREVAKENGAKTADSLISYIDNQEILSDESREIARFVFKNADGDKKNLLIKSLVKIPEAVGMIVEGLDGEHLTVDMEIAIRFLSEYCAEKFGLSEEEFSYIFDATAETGHFKDGKRSLPRFSMFFKNIVVMDKLEEIHPGGVRELADKFHIRMFGRYSAKILSEQLKMNEMPFGSRYGLILFPIADHNGAFFQYKDELESLNETFIEETGSPFLRVFECGSHKEALGILNFARKEYGPVTLAMIGGHGTPNSISFGSGKKRFEITIDEIEKYSKIANAHQEENSPSLFAEGSTTILLSCSTGAKDGIAQKLSSAFGTKVKGPDKPSAMADLITIIDKDQNKYVFYPTFINNATSKIYLDGSETDEL